jgi:membrane peptidoglycan carboxypeptidase
MAISSRIRRIAIRLSILLFGFGFVAGATVFGIAYFTVEIPDPNDYVNSQATIIQYADGSEVGRIGAQNRTVIALAKIPIHLREAVLAAEDRNFYNQSAFSVTGILRAAFNNLRGGQLQGGSTITQQYAKTAFLTADRNIVRKIKELIIAIKLENQLSKDEILEDYLNSIYFGRGAYGVETGAQVYFGHGVDSISVAESAILASILRSPGYYDPYFREGNKERLSNRVKYVINGMVDSGFLSKERGEKLKSKEPVVNPRLTSGQLSGPKGYLVSWVQRELNALGFSDEELLIGGLIVKTTLEKKAQEAAQIAVQNFGPSNAPDDLHIGLLSLRPGTGEIVAMYGGKDYLARQLNDATQGITQAGSTFKVFALIAALEQGIPLTSIWNGDSPQFFDDLGKPYRVSNYKNKDFGEVSLLKATGSSINTVYVPLGIAAGLENVVNAAKRAGIPESVAMLPTPSLVLGVSSPKVIDIAAAYATFAAEGIYAEPFIINEVQGSNKGVLYQAKIKAQEVFSPEIMRDVNYALRQVVIAGTATSALSSLGRQAAGKTGTSNDNTSAWFTGYTPDLATSIAFFRDDALTTLKGIGGINSLTGGSFPARIWNAYTKSALDGSPKLKFKPPAHVNGTDFIDMRDVVMTYTRESATALTPIDN